jgi:putative sterol carrier protein
LTASQGLTASPWLVWQFEDLAVYYRRGASAHCGQFAASEGELADPDLTLTLAAKEAARVFAGDQDARAAYMSGALKVKGELPGALKVQTLIEMVTEEIEY